MPEMRETDLKLSAMADRLRLTLMRDRMLDMLETATASHMTPRETLEYFFSREIDQRESNRIKIATMAAHFPKVCTLDGFDMSAQPSLDPGVMRELRKLEWVDTGENVILLGPPGVGKTHLAIGLGREAVCKGKSVLFVTAAALVSALEKAHAEGHLSERLAFYSKPHLLIIDELGYLPLTPDAANLLFQLIVRRYETKSILLTSNRSVGQWGMIFTDPTVTTAILDRLLHHCTPITINGDSYRIRSNKKLNTKKSAVPAS